MRHVLVLLMASFILGATCQAESKTLPQGHPLSWWIGKYPTTTADGRSINIFEQSPIKNTIERIVPPAERQRLDTYDSESPIKSMEGFIVIHKCKPHYCPAEFAFVVLDQSNNRMWAGFFSRKADTVSTRWYGNTDDYSVLPTEIKQEFLERHGD